MSTFDNVIIAIQSDEEYKAIQDLLFSKGFGWHYGGKEYCKIDEYSHNNFANLYLNITGSKIMYLTKLSTSEKDSLLTYTEATDLLNKLHDIFLNENDVIKLYKQGTSLEYCYKNDSDWKELTGDMSLNELCHHKNNYRIKIRKVEHTNSNPDGVLFPKPENKKPEFNTRYYIPRFGDDGDLFSSFTWVGDNLDNDYFKQGFVHLSEDNAIAHAKAIIKLNGGSYD